MAPRGVQLHAAQKANEALLLYWPTNSLPVDPIAIAHQLSVKVFAASLDDGIAGFLRKEPNRDAHIYVERTDSETRQRFACAHFLGHFVRHAPQRELAFVDERVARNVSAERADDEAFAETFAASLLMPAALLRPLIASADELALAKRFNVSVSAISARIEQLTTDPEAL